TFSEGNRWGWRGKNYHSTFEDAYDKAVQRLEKVAMRRMQEALRLERTIEPKLQNEIADAIATARKSRNTLSSRCDHLASELTELRAKVERKYWTPHREAHKGRVEALETEMKTVEKERDAAKERVMHLRGEYAVLTVAQLPRLRDSWLTPLSLAFPHIRAPRAQPVLPYAGAGRLSLGRLGAQPQRKLQPVEEERALGKGREMGLRAARRYWGEGY
ncbi:hypothetical protein JCM6882_004865, partial [Rhodosporidiobolus microsporus]